MNTQRRKTVIAVITVSTTLVALQAFLLISVAAGCVSPAMRIAGTLICLVFFCFTCKNSYEVVKATINDK